MVPRMQARAAPVVRGVSVINPTLRGVSLGPVVVEVHEERPLPPPPEFPRDNVVAAVFRLTAAAHWEH